MKTLVISRLVVLLTSLLLLFALTLAAVARGEEHRYQEQKGKKTILFTWKIEQTGAEVRISVLKNGKTYISTCNKEGVTRQYQFDDGQNSNYEASRVNNILSITGKKGAEPYENAVGLDDQPWFQPLYYALAQFLKSPYREISFWTIREGDIEPVVLSARKRGAETVVINNSQVETHKVEVKSDDFFSRLWRGFYWFQKGDNRLVMYRSEPGIPGAKETVVTLVSPQ